MGILPNCIIIGAMKCGTSSLYQYLDLHPQISMSALKEPCFFIKEVNWNKGVEWYKSLFNEASEIRGEASVEYTCYPLKKGVPERIKNIIPETKILYLVRDPIKRLVSHYYHYKASGYETRSFDVVIRYLKNNEYVFKSMYYMQLEQYLKCFSASNILVIQAEKLRNNKKQTLKNIFKFLNVEENYEHQDFSKDWHQTKEKIKRPHFIYVLEQMFGKRNFRSILPYTFQKFFHKKLDQNIKINEGQFEHLKAFLQKDVEKLKAFTGYSLEEWSL